MQLLLAYNTMRYIFVEHCSLYTRREFSVSTRDARIGRIYIYYCELILSALEIYRETKLILQERILGIKSKRDILKNHARLIYIILIIYFARSRGVVE